ncbi:hypothetical protein AB1Y20_016754 [Prymnesium parvum]|uniref:GAF domain-containing protein n=1 Tax=Prymnesium parvum TaxID=97485 RepID=A0AB34I8S8_PRYPA
MVARPRSSLTARPSLAYAQPPPRPAAPPPRRDSPPAAPPAPRASATPSPRVLPRASLDAAHDADEAASLREQLALLGAERAAEAARRAAAEAQLAAAAAEAAACRRSAAAALLLLQHKEAELARLRGAEEEGRKAKAKGREEGGEGGRKSVVPRRRSARAAELRQSVVELTNDGEALASHVATSPELAGRLIVRLLALFETSASWRLVSPLPLVDTPLDDPDAEANHEFERMLPLLRSVRWQLPAALECKACRLYLAQPRGIVTADAQGRRLPIDPKARGVVGEVLRHPAPINLPHAAAHAAYDKRADLWDGAEGEAAEAADEAYPLLSLPVLGVGGGVVGVLQLGGRAGGAPFDAADVMVAQLAADLVKSAMHNLLVCAGAAGFGAALLRFCRDLFGTDTAGGVVAQLEQWVRPLLHAASCSVLSMEDEEALGGVEHEEAPPQPAEGEEVDAVASLREKERAEHALLKGVKARIHAGDGAVIIDGSTLEQGDGSHMLFLPLTDPSAKRASAVVKVTRPAGAPPFKLEDARLLLPTLGLGALALSHASKQAWRGA